MRDSEKWDVVGRGFAGWHARAGSSSSSGGRLAPYTYWTGAKCAGYLQEARDGALVYDASAAEHDPEGYPAFFRLVICGPLVDTTLPDGSISRFTGAVKTIEKYDPAQPAQSFDSVSLDVFASLLRTIPTVRVGYKRGTLIQWDSGKTQRAEDIR